MTTVECPHCGTTTDASLVLCPFCMTRIAPPALDRQSLLAERQALEMQREGILARVNAINVLLGVPDTPNPPVGYDDFRREGGRFGE